MGKNPLPQDYRPLLTLNQQITDMEVAIPPQHTARKAGQMEVVSLQDMVEARKQEVKILLVAQRYAHVYSNMWQF